MKKPRIIPFKKKETKFSKKIKETPEFKKKELALASIGSKLGKLIDISKIREEKKVILKQEKISELLNNYFVESYKKKGKALKSNLILLHTHIEQKNNNNKKSTHTALPSKTDITNLSIMVNKFNQKYEVIPVLSKKGKEKGYTIIKVRDKNKIQKINQKDLEKRLIDKKVNEKIKIYNLLEEIGLEIYFSPMPGYRLNKNFNYVRK